MPLRKTCAPNFEKFYGPTDDEGTYDPLRVLPLIVATGQEQTMLAGVGQIAGDLLDDRGVRPPAQLMPPPAIECADPQRPRVRHRFDLALAEADAVLLLFGGELDGDCQLLDQVLDVSTRRRWSAWKDKPVAIVAAAERSELALEYAVHSVVGIGATPVAGVWLQPSLVHRDPREDQHVRASLTSLLGAIDLYTATTGWAGAHSTSRPWVNSPRPTG